METTILIKLIVAVFLGSLLGLERKVVGKAAGMRTFSLVTLAATIFVIINGKAPELFDLSSQAAQYDFSRVVADIAIGVGFLGTGLIVFKSDDIRGLTTAAAVWLAAAIGVAVGVGEYAIASVATALGVIILHLMFPFEQYLDSLIGKKKE